MTPRIRLGSPGKGFRPHEDYLYTTLLDTLAIPYTRHQGCLLLWPEVASGQEVELEIGDCSHALAALARMEERQGLETDGFNRFPFSASEFAVNFDCPVDVALRQLAAELETTIGNMGGAWRQPSTWPGNAPFAVCLTHDVDWLWKWTPRKLAKQLFLNGLGPISHAEHRPRWQRLVRDLQSVRRRENPYWNLSDIASGEQEFGFRSTFFVLAGRWHSRDGDYNLEDPKILRLLEKLQSQGAEIALHGSYLSFNRPDLMAWELEHLRSALGDVWGVRQHYLRFDIRSTPKIHESLGLKYDSTLGFAEHEGYRSGFSYPHFPYSCEEQRPLEVLEIPLTVMDATLFRYRRLTPELAWLAIKDQLEYVKGSGGCCTLLWHNNYFDEEEYPGYGQLYWRALAWIAEHGGWASSACEIAAWWRNRAGRHI